MFRLNYKYSRLIDSSQSRDGELPAADVCAFEEGEEEDEDEVTNFLCLNLVLHFRGLDDCFKLSILFLLTSRIFSRLYFLYDYIFSLYSGVTSYKYFLCTSQYKQRKSLLLIVYFVLFEQNFINSPMSLWKIVLYGVCFFIFRLYFQDLKEKHRRSWTVWKEWERYIYF